MLHNALKGALHPAVKSALNPLAAAVIIERYFTRLDAAAGSHYLVSQGIPVPAKFTVTLKYAMNAGAGWDYFYDHSGELGGGRNYLAFITGLSLNFSDSMVSAKFDDATVPSNYSLPRDGKLHALESKFNRAAAGFITHIAARFNGLDTLEGYLYGMTITDTTTGQLICDYRFDDGDGVLVDYSGNGHNGQAINVSASNRELYYYTTTPTPRWVGKVSGNVIEVA